MPGTLEVLDRLARDFVEAVSSDNKDNQNVLLEKARQEQNALADKKDQKR